MAQQTGTTLEELLATAERLADLGSFEVRLPSMERTWSPGFHRIHGLDPHKDEATLERLMQAIHPEDRDRVADAVRGAIGDPTAVRPEGVRLEYRVVLPDGSLRHLRALGHADREPDGSAGRWFGIVQDVTEQELTERDLRAHYAVSQALRAWESIDEGVLGLLRRMATALEYPVAALWTYDKRQDRVVCRALWTEPDLDLGDFELTSRNLTFRPGEGLPGRAWTSGAPLFVPDIAADEEFASPQAAAQAGLRSALLFPAQPDGDPIALLAFYGFDRRDPSPRLIRTLSGIGAELGRFLELRRAQLEPSPLSARELEVLALAAEGLSGPRIADRLFVSPSTIKTHFENIYDKLGVSDRAGAVAQAMRVGLIR